MTLSIEAKPARRRKPSPQPRPGAEVALRRRAAAAVTVAGPAITRIDRFTRHCYASAAAGVIVTLAAVVVLRFGPVAPTSGWGLLLTTAAVLGASMIVGGGVAGSARPRTGGTL